MRDFQPKRNTPARVFRALIQAGAAAILAACGTFSQPQPQRSGAQTPSQNAAPTAAATTAQSNTAPSGTATASAGVPQTGQGQTPAAGSTMAAATTTNAAAGSAPTSAATSAATSGAAQTPTTAAAAAPGATATASTAAGSGNSGAGTLVMFGPVNRDPSQAALSPGLAVGTTSAGGPPDLWVTWAENAPGGVRETFASERVTAAQPSTGAFQPRGATINIHANVVADIPTIAFAGENRMVPWDAWVEPSPGFNNIPQVFVSRFNTNTGLWQQTGKNRGGSEASVNIHTYRAASAPFLFAGTTDTTKPLAPWVTWLEQSNVSNVLQVFTSKAVEDNKAIGGFRWDPVGQLDAFNEPTLNIDRSRDASHPVGVFAETGRTVPWITWYEEGNNRPARIYTVRGVVDSKVPGGFRWIQVPPCTPSEIACALNINPLRDAEDPTMAAGSQNPGEAPVPWIAWSEDGPSGKSQIFVSRLDLTSRNSFLQVGGSLNVDQTHTAITPFIAFVKNVPYVAWLEDDGTGKYVVQVRHLASDSQTGNWVLDSPKNGFSANPTITVTGLYAVGSDEGFYLAWTEGDPAKSLSRVITAELKP